MHTIFDAVCKRQELQGDPNRNFLFQIAPLLNWYIFDPMLVKPKCVWQVAVFFSVSWFFQAFEIYLWKIVTFSHQPLWSWGKALDWHAKGPGFDSPLGHKISTFGETFTFFGIFEKFIFNTKNCHFSNTFWLYQPWVKYLPF